MGFFSRKQDLFNACFGAQPEPEAPALRVVPVSSLQPSGVVRTAFHDGEKFEGGWGATNILWTDYWTLRARSVELFQRNLYGRGLIRRMVTNEINVGLHLESTPEEGVLGYQQDGLADWTELVENRFAIWANNPRLCDHEEKHTLGELQQMIRRESLVAGDVLVVVRQDQRTKLPRVQLHSGGKVQTPVEHMFSDRRGANKITHGVEIDATGKHVAYWIRQDDGKSKRLPAWGEKSGRRLAWLVYGTDKLLEEVRGQPLLALVTQSLKEIDRYRDSVQRKAVINAMIAVFLEKTQDKPGSRSLTGSGITRRTEATVDNAGKARSFKAVDAAPGLVIEELQVGEKPQGFMSHGTDEKFGDFERAIIAAVAWAQEIPPEILLLSFNSNYSASQAAINEYKLYLNPTRARFGKAVCTPLYQEWLLSELLDRRIDAPGLLDAWRDPKRYDKWGAWVSCDWSGNIKPAVDVSKLVRGYATMVAQGFITRDRATRELTGMKYSKVVQRLALENEQLAKALSPLSMLEAAVRLKREPIEDSDVDDVEDEERKAS